MTEKMSHEIHKYDGKWSIFDFNKEVGCTFLACQKRGTLVFVLKRGASQFEAVKPYWTLEDIAYKDEAWPINLIDAQGERMVAEYRDLTIDWRFALDYAKERKYTLNLKLYPE